MWWCLWSCNPERPVPPELPQALSAEWTRCAPRPAEQERAWCEWTALRIGIEARALDGPALAALCPALESPQIAAMCIDESVRLHPPAPAAVCASIVDPRYAASCRLGAADQAMMAAHQPREALQACAAAGPLESDCFVHFAEGWTGRWMQRPADFPPALQLAIQLQPAARGWGSFGSAVGNAAVVLRWPVEDDAPCAALGEHAASRTCRQRRQERQR